MTLCKVPVSALYPTPGYHVVRCLLLGEGGSAGLLPAVRRLEDAPGQAGPSVAGGSRVDEQSSFLVLLPECLSLICTPRLKETLPSSDLSLSAY